MIYQINFFALRIFLRSKRIRQNPTINDWYHWVQLATSGLRFRTAWWHHQMEPFSALLTIWAGNSPVTGALPAQRPVPRSFDVFFYLRLNKRLSKQSWGWWFETLSRPLWRHCNGMGRARHISFSVCLAWCLCMTLSDLCRRQHFIRSQET